MKTKWLILFIIACAGWSACKNKDPKLPCICPDLLVAPFINVKIVDKTTGDDLFLSPGSPYKFSDLKVTTSLPGGSVEMFVDSMQTNNRFVRILSSESQTFILKLAALKADTMAVVTRLDSPKCCPIFVIKQVTLNNKLVCNPCSISQLVTIKK